MNKNAKKQWDIIIIGAGASGMMAAITAKRAGKQVLILEQSDKPGKKILATGNGKCNFTNAYMNNDCFRGDTNLSKQVLSEFSAEDCLHFFHSIGIYPKERNGYYYPNSEQAASVVIAMTEELKHLAVQIHCLVCVNEIHTQKKGFSLSTNQGEYTCKKLIVATGLLAAPKLGSNGSLLDAIKSLGHHFSPIVPALCGFYCSGMPFKKVSGVRAMGQVRAVIDGEIKAVDTGEVQFTDYGLSGIPVFQISRFLSIGLYEKRNVRVHLDMLPEFQEETLLKELSFRQKRGGSLELYLNGLLNKKLSDALWDMLHFNSGMSVSDLSKKQIQQICKTLKEMVVTVNKYRDYEFAQVCAGGIPAAEVETDSFASKLVDNLYFAGEILNVDGICGGYNLHFAWGSGKIAAENACRE